MMELLQSKRIYTSGLFMMVILTAKVALTAEPFDIHNFTNPYKYGWSAEECRLRERDQLFLETMVVDQYSERKQSPVTNALKSAIAPGWGHFSVGSYTKGQVFLGAQLVLLGTGIYYREKAMIEYRKYEEATRIGDINNYYESALTPYRQSNLLLSLSLILWSYTIYDTILETNQHNWELWDSLSQTQLGANLYLTPTSITFRF